MYPQNAYHLPFLPLQFGWRIASNTSTGRPWRERKIDILHRSSHCDPARWELVRGLYLALRAHNLTFAAVGYCRPDLNAVGHENRAAPRFANKHWGDADARLDEAKMIIAFEFSEKSPQSHYLSEKPFMPLVHGGLPLYRGNGQGLWTQLGLAPQKLIDRDRFDSDRAYIDEVVRILRDEQRCGQPRQRRRGVGGHRHGRRVDDTEFEHRVPQCAHQSPSHCCVACTPPSRGPLTLPAPL